MFNKRYAEMLGLTKVDFDEVFSTEESGKEFLSALNGFCNEGNEEYVGDRENFEKVLRECGLVLDNIYFFEGHAFMTRIEHFIYLHREFTFKCCPCNNAQEMFEFIKSGVKRLDNYLDAKSSEEKEKLSFQSLLFRVPQSFEIAMFNIFSEKLTENDIKKIGRNLYKSKDYGAHLIWDDLIRRIFEGGEQKKSLTLYRGVGSKSTSLEDAYAWTTSKDVALFFATRFARFESDLSNIKVYKCTFEADDILYVFEDDKEKEVIVDIDSIEYYIENDLIEELEFDKSKTYTC